MSIIDNATITNSQAHIWEKTNNIRIHRLVTHYNWSTQWDPVYIQTFQQQWLDRTNGDTKWISLEILEEEVPNAMRYG